jgi:CRP/FNR family transcriptional regulator, cyclic AMP receptor protein
VTRRFSVPLDEADEPAEEVLFLPEASGSDWAEIFNHATAYVFHPGDRIAYAGEPDRALYLLVEGRVQITSGGEPLKEIDAPSVLGEVAFLDGGPRSAGIVALSEGEVVRFDMDAYGALAERNPDLGRRMALDLGRIAALRLRLLSARDDYPLGP